VLSSRCHSEERLAPPRASGREAADLLIGGEESFFASSPAAAYNCAPPTRRMGYHQPVFGTKTRFYPSLDKREG
jgi:hypothetical protein